MGVHFKELNWNGKNKLIALVTWMKSFPPLILCSCTLRMMMVISPLFFLLLFVPCFTYCEIHWMRTVHFGDDCLLTEECRCDWFSFFIVVMSVLSLVYGFTLHLLRPSLQAVAFSCLSLLFYFFFVKQYSNNRPSRWRDYQEGQEVQPSLQLLFEAKTAKRQITPVEISPNTGGWRSQTQSHTPLTP